MLARYSLRSGRSLLRNFASLPALAEEVCCLDSDPRTHCLPGSARALVGGCGAPLGNEHRSFRAAGLCRDPLHAMCIECSAGAPQTSPGISSPTSRLTQVVETQAFSTKAAPAFSHTPPGRNHLFVPGPVNIQEDVLRAMSVPGQNHRDPWFAELFK